MISDKDPLSSFADRAADRAEERARYDRAARREVALGEGLPSGAEGLPTHISPPYVRFEEHIRRVVKPRHVVLEIGSGSGRHTVSLVAAGATVVALDISEAALGVNRRRTEGHSAPVCADMMALPAATGSVDVVTCAGSLSYGKPELVNEEIRRVLKPGGCLILVDSLNHNPVYRLNRWVAYRRGERSKATLDWMPTIRRIESLTRCFSQVQIDTYGTFAFLHPVAAAVMSAEKASKLCNNLDESLGRGRNAFKVVACATGYEP